MSKGVEDRARRGELDPVYVLASSDPLLLERALAAIRDAAVPDAARAFNFDVVDGRGATADRVLAAAQTLPMMAQRRLVEVRGAGDMAAAELAGLAAYLESPNPTTVLVLVVGKPDKRVKFFQAAKKRGYLHELAAPRQLGAWVKEEARRRGVAMRPQAEARLVDAVGSDLARLALSIDQLALYAGDRPVEVGDVEELIADTRERTVFELTDAVGAGDRKRALGAVSALFDQRQSPIGVVVMLGRQFRQLALCHRAMAARVPNPEAARMIGVPPFVVDKLYAQARRFAPGAIARGTVLLSDADRALKGQFPATKALGKALAERVIVERLVTELLELRR